MMTRLVRGKWRRARSGERAGRRNASTQTTTLAVVGARRHPVAPPPPVPPPSLPTFRSQRDANAVAPPLKSNAQMLEATSRMPAENCVEYEELVLRRPNNERPRLLRYRSRPQPPLGITLCYGTYFGLTSPGSRIADSADTNIFVAAVDRGSVAERDGRIRVGDQILQINGVSIHNRRDAIEQFSKPSETVRLLLARSQREDEPFETPSSCVRQRSSNPADVSTLTAQKSSNDRKDIALPPSTYSIKRSINSNDVVTKFVACNTALRRNSVAEKATDSGLSRGTDDSEDHDVPIHSPVLDAECCHFLRNDSASRLVLEESLEADLAQLNREMETIRLECERLIRRHVAHNSHPRTKSNVAHPNTSACYNATEMIEKHGHNVPATLQQSCEMRPAQRHSAQLPAFLEETSSSAYNTGGDSCRSTPLKHETNAQEALTFAQLPNNSANRPQQLELHGKIRGNISVPSDNFYHTIDTPTTVTMPSTETPTIATTNAPVTTKFRLPKVRIRDEYPSPPPRRMRLKQPLASTKTSTGSASLTVTNTKCGSERNSTSVCSHETKESSSTSADRLAENIALQQRMLREAMIGEATILGGVATSTAPPMEIPTSSITPHIGKSTEPFKAGQSTAHISRPSCFPRLSCDAIPATNSHETTGQFEWKVRRRPDGTRYVTRRPVRAQVMKAREEEVNRERFALSTDDDAASELKLGRFWSRDERKRHLERAKQRKIRHMKLIHEQAKRAAAGERELLQLSRAKQSRRNRHNLYDHFTTVQELLAHGTAYCVADPAPALPTTAGAPMRIINVTTV